MLSQNAKDLFARLGLPYPAIAVKFSFDRPEGIPRTDEALSFCQFVKKAQDSGKTFYITAQDDNCCGKIALGMIPKQPFTASGMEGADFGVYRTPAPNARLHQELPVLTHGAHNYVTFAPVADCQFNPDLVICVAQVEQAEILMRATSYISGDLWESRSSSVVSCAWTYAYPYISGKVNTCISGMHNGLKRRKIYPSGLHIISIPYQKLGEVVEALGEMDWVPIGFREDEQSKAELRARMDHWQEIIAQSNIPHTDVFVKPED